MSTEVAGIAEHCALGLVPMLICAIGDHRRRHHGDMPRRFEMHPANFQQLLIDTEVMCYVQFACDGTQKFHGVEIVEDPARADIAMITSRNMVEYL